ncbi:zinc finger protein 346 [Parasteatoda tepidariorum]|uniref:zinc finger protein 346 n=1 Tax=Parasteatoda tepidariorum TaxID=114398 RepID=UPI00077FAF30|nr:zinc finger RNA-binding protein [Parasteatoda tepidariorum]XP_042906184.1 zinc finger RNA-binding protein [Parasteatoda tepidariorum]
MMAEVKSKTAAEPKTDFKCKICQMTFSDIYAYTDHLESKQHVKGIMKQKYGQKYLEAKEMLEEKHSKNNIESSENGSIEEKTNTHESEKDDDSDTDEDDVYTCDVCEKICTGLINYKLHLSGNKHLKKLKQIKTMKELKEKQMIPNGYKAPDTDLLSQIMSKNVYASSDLMCEICNVKCTGPEVFKQHCKGEAHKKKEVKLRLKKEMEADGMPANTSREDFEDTYSCDVCSKAFTGILPYKQHLESTTHLKQKRKNQSLEKVKDLCITSSSNAKLRCKECNKTFTGPAPFEDHLKSSSHGKLKKKKNLYEELEKNYPEMLKTSIRDDSESEDSDGEIVKPACGICNMIFSGPEVALEHFSSEKHTKALKKKKRIDKNKRDKKAQNSVKETSVRENKEKLKRRNVNEEECSSDDSFERISP